MRFVTAVRSIHRKHSELGHKLGWRFLYTPAKTFNRKTSIVFIGLNPGGRRFEPPRPSVEDGNAYSVEPWGRDGNLNALQKQVCAFYRLISSALPGSDPNTLMNQTLSANFCPFRSSSWKKLHRKDDSVRFAQRLWSRIFEFVRPDLIITLGSQATRQIDALLMASGASVKSRRFNCNWGSITYRLAIANIANKRVLLIALPHLSHFKIFNRSTGNSYFLPLIKAVRHHLRKASTR
jgi:hypothetical protein